MTRGAISATQCGITSLKDAERIRKPTSEPAASLSMPCMRFLITPTLKLRISDRGDYSGRVGGAATTTTEALNIVSGTLFIFGVIFFIVFAGSNV